MKRLGLIFSLWGLICALSLLCPAGAHADAVATRPASEKETALPARVETASPPAHSVFDSKAINRSEGGGASTPKVMNLPGLGLPRVAGALAIVIALIFVLRWAARKMFLPQSSRTSVRAVQILARSPVSHRQNIMLLRVGRRVIVVGDSGTQMNPLSEITDADEIASLLGQLQEDHAHLPTKAFGAMFRRFRSDMGTEEESMADSEGTETEASNELEDQPAEDPSISDTREEITGLMDKVRLLSKHFRGGPA